MFYTNMTFMISITTHNSRTLH